MFANNGILGDIKNFKIVKFSMKNCTYLLLSSPNNLFLGREINSFT